MEKGVLRRRAARGRTWVCDGVRVLLDVPVDSGPGQPPQDGHVRVGRLINNKDLQNWTS